MTDSPETDMEADNGLPDVFRAVFREHWDRFVDANPDKVTDLSANPKVFGSLARVWTCSEFVRNGLLRYPADLRFLLDTQLADRRSAWEMQPDGSYIQLDADSDEPVVGSQQAAIARAEQRHNEATRLRRRKIRGVKPGPGSSAGAL